MKTRYFFFLSLLLALTPLIADEKPNVVFFLADDLGQRDLGAYGSTFHETPHLDQLAKDGMLFTDAYAACPVCSPTRASILTGRHPVRVGITDYIPGMRAGKKLAPRFQHVDDLDALPLEEMGQRRATLAIALPAIARA